MAMQRILLIGPMRYLYKANHQNIFMRSIRAATPLARFLNQKRFFPSILRMVIPSM
jgi:hypothetical protein